MFNQQIDGQLHAPIPAGMVLVDEEIYNTMTADLSQTLEENAGFNDMLNADSQLAAAAAEIRALAATVAQQQEEVRVLKASRDGYMNGKNEAIRLIKSLQRKLAKLA